MVLLDTRLNVGCVLRVPVIIIITFVTVQFQTGQARGVGAPSARKHADGVGSAGLAAEMGCKT